MRCEDMYQISILDNYAPKETLIERENAGEEGGLELIFRVYWDGGTYGTSSKKKLTLS